MKLKGNNKQIIAGLVLLLLLILLLYIVFKLKIQTVGQADATITEYEKEFVLIADGKESQFWQSVYESGLKAAKEDGAYLEWMEQSGNYSMVDYIKIAMHSKVDGILICPDGTEEVEEQLTAAVEAGIPIVTLVDDASDTGRISCVGLNAYQTGQLFAKEILSEITEDTQKITILVDENSSSSKESIFGQIKSNINSQLGEDSTVVIENYPVSEGNSFDAEEEVRNIFLDSDSLPDILVCLSDTDSQAACQAVVDHNQVGNVKIYGYYISDTVLDAIEKGIVEASVTPDTARLGSDAIHTINEYISAGYVSEYTSINLNVVTKNNVVNYLEAEDNEESME